MTLTTATVITSIKQGVHITLVN